MQLEDYFEFIEPNYIRIKGHRIGIESIISKYLAGQTPEDISRHYDTLRLVDIYATITYYLQNKEVVDAYLQRTEQLIADDKARVTRILHWSSCVCARSVTIVARRLDECAASDRRRPFA